MNLKDTVNTVLQNKYSALFFTPKIYPQGKCCLFKNSCDAIIIYKPEEIESGFNRLNSLLDKNLKAYGIINYEFGYYLEKKFRNISPASEPLFQFYFFESEQVEELSPDQFEYSGLESLSYSISDFKLNMSGEEFSEKIFQIKKYIENGDTYQVNLTMKGHFSFKGSIGKLFYDLLSNQSARYSCIINLGERVVLSLSPELFFEVTGSTITAMPMKGTIRRGINQHSDLIQYQTLKESEKDKAENVMIVDLLRNDLGRISTYGSVSADQLFDIEKYETLYQMVSTITAQLHGQTKFSEIIKNIFPCGSVTGAPKIRTMEIIHQLEKEPRGIYTGAIGILSKEIAVFNVAIRTLSINTFNGRGEIGIGSGIVWDSEPGKEFQECKLKADFLLKPKPHFELFETMLVEGGNIFLFDLHLERLKNSAEFFLFDFTETVIRAAINSALSKINMDNNYRLRLSLNKWGKVKVSLSEFIGSAEAVKVILSDEGINSNDAFFYFKTSNRNKYDEKFRHYSNLGFFDVIFFNEKFEITEGTITNVFLKIQDNWITPPISCGLLAGVYRKYFMQMNQNVIEKSITRNDLINAENILLTNSLRKEIFVDRLYLNETEYIEFRHN